MLLPALSKTITLFAVAFISLASGLCNLGGSESGDCLNKEQVIDSISFCKEYIPSKVCVPFVQVGRNQFFRVVTLDSLGEGVLDICQGCYC